MSYSGRSAPAQQLFCGMKAGEGSNRKNKDRAHTLLPTDASRKETRKEATAHETDYGIRCGNVLGEGQKSAGGIVVPGYWNEGPNGAPRGD